jgi:hypothetical protein
MAVMVGVPVLQYAMNTINAASDFELARDFAERIHNSTSRVDMGEVTEIHVQIVVPIGTGLNSSGHTLNIVYQAGGSDPVTWSEDYAHEIELIGPSGSGICTLSISISDSVLHIEFAEPT